MRTTLFVKNFFNIVNILLAVLFNTFKFCLLNLCFHIYFGLRCMFKNFKINVISEINNNFKESKITIMQCVIYLKMSSNNLIKPLEIGPMYFTVVRIYSETTKGNFFCRKLLCYTAQIEPYSLWLKSNADGFTHFKIICTY